MIRTLTSKTALFVALAAGFIGLAALALWAQTAKAQTSSPVSITKLNQVLDVAEDTNGADTTGGGAVTTQIEIELKVSGNNRFVQVNGGTGATGDYEIRSVSDEEDCNPDDFSDGELFHDGSGKFAVDSGGNTTIVKDTFTVAEIDAATGNVYADHDNNYLCVKATYLETGRVLNPGNVDVSYVSWSRMLDTEAPEVKTDVSLRTHTYGLGDNIDLVVEFSEPISVKSLTDDEGDVLSQPHIVIPNLGNAEFHRRLGSSSLVFRYTVEFDDKDSADANEPLELADIRDFTIVLGDDYAVADTAGNRAGTTSAGITSTEDIDFNGSEVFVELDVEAKQQGTGTNSRIVVEVTPDEWDDDGDSTTPDVTTLAASSPVLAYESEDPFGDCEDAVADGDATASSATVTAVNGVHGIGVDADPDNMYYCFRVTDAQGRMFYTNTYHYAEDTTPPRISFAYNNNVLTVSASDTESGVNESTLKYFWSEIAANNLNKACDERVSTSEFNINTDDGMFTITVRPSYHDDKICVRVENNQGDERVVEHQLQYVDPGTVTPTDPTDPTPVDPDPTDPTDPAPTDPVEGQVRVPRTWPGQAAWDALSVNEKISSNPWGCVDATKIRGDNGQCLSGGTTLTDDDYVYVNSLADSGDSSSTPAPAPVDPAPVDPAPVDPAPVDPTPVDPTPTDPTPTPTDPGDGDTGDDTGRSLSLSFSADDNMVQVDVADGVSNVMYVVQDEGDQCSEEGVSAGDAAAVEGGSIEVSAADVEDGRQVCVFATMTDADGNEKTVYESQSLSAAEAGDDSEGTDTEDEEGGGGGLVWIIAVVVVLIIGIVIALVFSGKRNQ